MENAPSNKTQALKKIINMGIWVVDTWKQVFIRSSYTEFKFKYKLVNGNTPFFAVGPFCTSHRFGQPVLYENLLFSILVLSNIKW